MPVTRLGRVQLRIMNVLWERRRATAREITETLSELEPIAHSTVQTLLRGLEEKGAVAHESDGRTFVFHPLVEQGKYRRSATRDFVDRVFGGQHAELMAYLLKHEQIPADELRELRKLIDEHSKKRGKP